MKKKQIETLLYSVVGVGAMWLEGWLPRLPPEPEFLAAFGPGHSLSGLLPAHDIPCALELHPDLGHDFPPEFERSLVAALEFVTQG